MSAAWWRRAWCALRNGGHLFVRHCAPDRFAERCWLCGYIKGGWPL